MLEEILEEIKEEFDYIGKIEIKEDNSVPLAAIDLATNTLLYNKSIFKETAIKDIIRHEIGHLAYVPYTLENAIYLDIKLLEERNLEEEKVRKLVLNLFFDAKVNLRLIYRYKHNTNIEKVYKRTRSRLFKLYLALLTEFSRKIGVNKKFVFDKNDLNYYLRRKLEELLKIDWLDSSKGYVDFCPEPDEILPQLLRFYDIIKDIIPKRIPKDIPRDIQDVPVDVLKKIVRRLVRKEKISENTALKYLRSRMKKKIKKGGVGGGNLAYPDESLIAVYLGVIDRYKIKIKKKLIESGSEEILKFDKWSIGDRVEDLYVFSPIGHLVIPGISTKVVRTGEKSFVFSESLPDVLLIIDDSGSMPNTSRDIVINGVIAGIIARHYIVNGARVGIIKFSSTTRFRGWFSNLEEALKYILEYEGGGTVLDVNVVKKAISVPYKIDVILITDACFNKMQNFEEYVKVINSAENVVRSYVFICGYSLNESVVSKGKTKVYYVRRWEEIPRIVIK